MMIVKSELKKSVLGFSIASDFYESAELKLQSLVKDAIRRAEANGRKTVMAKDL